MRKTISGLSLIVKRSEVERKYRRDITADCIKLFDLLGISGDAKEDFNHLVGRAVIEQVCNDRLTEYRALRRWILEEIAEETVKQICIDLKDLLMEMDGSEEKEEEEDDD